MIESPKPTHYAVFEHDPGDCREIGLSLAEAFHSIMTHCDYNPVWDVDGLNLRLRFRYSDEPLKGRLVGDAESDSYIETFYAPAFAGEHQPRTDHEARCERGASRLVCRANGGVHALQYDGIADRCARFRMRL